MKEKNSNFYTNVSDDLITENERFFNEVREYSNKFNMPVYIIDRPLTDRRYDYSIKKVFIILIPKHKIIFINAGDDNSSFENFILDFLDDAGSLSDRYEFRKNLGRSRTWKSKFTFSSDISSQSFSDILKQTEIKDDITLTWQCELLLSILLGSINDVERIGSSPAETELDKIKNKIILFDAEQTRFIFQEPNHHSKEIRIQGLSGTGKTELLLHKIKELYTKPTSPKIAISCHNKVLASSLRERIPDFFDFMKIEQQIKWNDKLFCFHAWGSGFNKFSGLYRYICDFYSVPFFSFSRSNTFDKVCKITLDSIRNRLDNNEISDEEKYAFDYILLDESQDFPNEFFELCELVVKNKLYIAGDIFQSIFDNDISLDKKADYLLNKCYRTDPKTLMLSHSIGMGLFEDRKIRWLSQDLWEACGYIYSEDNGTYKLSRDPLRRFEDIDSNPFSIDFIKFDFQRSVVDYIINKIDDIKKIHLTVKPEDICIVFPVGSELYNYAELLKYEINKTFGYSINMAHESKKSKQDNAIFLSNKNNVKGLEFAFVICVVPYLTKEKNKSNLMDRNAIYMSLTRSYIQSFLLLNSGDKYINENENSFRDGAENILSHGYIEGKIPSESEINEIHEELNALKSKPSITLAEVLDESFDRHKIEPQRRQKIADMIEASFRTGSQDWTEEYIDNMVSGLKNMAHLL